jgi:hypothetical protein
LHLFREDRVHGTSLQPYLAAINRVHRDLGLPAPADGHLINTARRGFVRLHQQAAVPAPGQVTQPTRAQRHPVPAAVAIRAVQHGLITTDDHVRTCCAIVVHAFLFMGRASSVSGVPVSAYSFDSSCALSFREDARKTGGPSRLLHVPFVPHGLGDRHPLLFLHRFHQQRLQSCLQHRRKPHHVALFFHPQLPAASSSTVVSAALTEVLRVIDFTVPPGTAFTSHSLRSGGATAALATGASLPAVMAWGGWRSLSSVQRYIDPTVRANAATNVFFNFLKSHS